ncbi:MAG: hypothetical protein V2I50_06830 [Desulfuromusa sp.]|jgi:hypothetical protein|nr:hypothetical protein [Desulfuromusa sp.]
MADDYREMKSALSSLRSNAFNIQSLLRMAQDGQNSTEILTKITYAIENHFDRVESLHLEIPEENREDHRQILKQFETMRDDWLNGMMTETDYAEALNLRLFNHFSSYFQPLLDTYLDDASTLQFRV